MIRAQDEPLTLASWGRERRRCEEQGRVTVGHEMMEQPSPLSFPILPPSSQKWVNIPVCPPPPNLTVPYSGYGGRVQLILIFSSYKLRKVANVIWVEEKTENVL